MSSLFLRDMYKVMPYLALNKLLYYSLKIIYYLHSMFI